MRHIFSLSLAALLFFSTFYGVAPPSFANTLAEPTCDNPKDDLRLPGDCTVQSGNYTKMILVVLPNGDINAWNVAYLKLTPNYIDFAAWDERLGEDAKSDPTKWATSARINNVEIGKEYSVILKRPTQPGNYYVTNIKYVGGLDRYKIPGMFEQVNWIIDDPTGAALPARVERTVTYAIPGSDGGVLISLQGPWYKTPVSLNSTRKYIANIYELPPGVEGARVTISHNQKGTLKTDVVKANADGKVLWKYEFQEGPASEGQYFIRLRIDFFHPTLGNRYWWVQNGGVGVTSLTTTTATPIATAAGNQTSTPTPTPRPTFTPIPTQVIPPTSTPLPARPPGWKDWTFILYAAADNNLHNSILKGLQRLDQLPENKNVNIVVFFDGYNRNDTERWVVQPGGNYTTGINRWHLAEANTGDPKTLSDFVLWARQNYPATHTYLSILSHGTGVRGTALDDTSTKDLLEISELRQALATATQNGANKLDVLHFDSCLMGMFENAYQFKNYANFMIASQNQSWSEYFYDRYVRLIPNDITQSLSARDLVSSVITTVGEQFNQPRLRLFPYTISVVDLTQASAVKTALDGLGQLLVANLDQIKQPMQGVRKKTQKYDSTDDRQINDADAYIDLGHLASNINTQINQSAVQAAAQTLQTSVSKFVLAHRQRTGLYSATEWRFDNSSGTSIYFPPTRGGIIYDDYLVGNIYDFTQSGYGWGEFLSKYYDIVPTSGSAEGDPDLVALIAPEASIFLPLAVNQAETREVP